MQKPSPELRCDFCKEVDLDTYDEDFMIMKYYKKSVDIKTVAHDILVDEKELEALCKKHKISDFNSAIAYEDNNLSEKKASGSTTVKYIGQLQQASDENLSDDSTVHHLWVGENKLDKKNILKQAGIDKDKVMKLNYYHTAKSGKLDEILILQVEDYNVAEKMILKVDTMKITTANSMLDLVVKGNIKIEGDKIGNNLNMNYIGKFEF
ncbi:hypothetical protein J3D55_001519 [Chryseobacterium ginsenosidimutans]|uniref:immunity 22 family protein n=1 Tax=Chryseobacterium ginsenosidimutans TaxID=687846 RepID=UPI0021676B46|nr:immunity 22 family protein [Chryseobacterium ginsenosidimutans]MCS3868603.1 hypothetical protein [Chryseobacterium ginsenosidimutans]